jgi:hypothetical protein
MAFTTGLISSPAPATGFLYGTVVTPDWANLVSGNINDYIAYKAALTAGTVSVAGITVDGVGGNTVTANAGVTRTYFIPAAGMQVGSGSWTYTSQQYWTAGNAGIFLMAPILLPFKTSTFASTITAVSARILIASGSGFGLDLFKATNMSTTSTPVFASVGTGVNSGSGEQTVTVSGLSELLTSDKLYYLRVQSSAAGDKIYGLSVTYSTPIY